MAVLSDADRQRVATALMRWWSNERESQPWLKQVVRDSVNAADSWQDSNAASYNTALPVTFRTAATAGQKALLFLAVALMRYSPALLRRLFGEVD